MTDQQKTISQVVELEGLGLHTGNQVRVRLHPADAGTGIRFVRVDLPERPVIRAGVENIIINTMVPRCTSIGKDGVIIHTVEHLMSALCGLGIDNLLVEMDGNELPGLDGSGLAFYEAIKTVGVVEQPCPREYFDIKEPICVNNNGACILVVPDDDFRISYTLDYDQPSLQTQFFSTTVNAQSFEEEIAPCRTFCLEEEANELKAKGLGKGANFENTLVVGARGVINNELKFPNECARHKVLDFIGDSYLLGHPLKGQVFCVRSGHSLNFALLKKILRQREIYQKKSFVPDAGIPDNTELDIQQLMKILPHRYPFLLVDRIVALEKGKRAVGIKNVTINENFFTGHFPTRPVMPGVLMVEALAQTGGVLMLTNGNHHGKVALFMATDNVKFRKLVEPGDQLVLDVELVRDRPSSAMLKGQAKVAGQVVAEADIIFSFVDASFLNS